jgi:GNAT superfamily N-acetyltransferase
MAADAAFLTRVLAIAADWRPGLTPRPVAEVMASPELAHYIADWPREGDFGVVAETTVPVGAAWWRFLGRDDPGFGYVDDGIPEISVGVIEAARGKGLGRAMLGALVQEAVRREVRALSLSVEPDNHAMYLYEKVGFRKVGYNGGAATMVLALEPRT